MKRVASHESLAYLGHLRNVLEQSGIACLIRNEQLSGGLGEIPFLECLPELWVVRDNQLRAAQTLLDELRDTDAVAATAPAWRCGSCGELNEGQFAACWHCGRPDDREA